MTDGQNYVNLPNAKDYKRIGEGDTGLNTGGMGAVSPVPFANEEFMAKVESQVIKPTIDGFKKDGIPYVGFVFFGLIKENGEPKVIEYNCRMGDPETEVVMPRIESDFMELLVAAAKKELAGKTLEISEKSCCTVMLVSGGYPEAYEKGKVITGLKDITESIPFHAGTKLEEGKVLTNGGRVIAVSSYGTDFKEALGKSYSSISKVCFEDINFRKDIGFDL